VRPPELRWRRLQRLRDNLGVVERPRSTRRSASARPAIPLRSYSWRQAITFGRESPTCSAIPVFDTPSAANSTTRAGWARPARIVVLRVIEASRSRSPSRSAKAAEGWFGMNHF
jgi:hypothetical protein